MGRMRQHHERRKSMRHNAEEGVEQVRHNSLEDAKKKKKKIEGIRCSDLFWDGGMYSKKVNAKTDVYRRVLSMEEEACIA